MSAESKVAIITGASQGIGAGLVRGFRERGFRVVANSRSIEPDAFGDPDVLAVAGDIADPRTAERPYPNRAGQPYRLKYSPAHRWFYFPEMRRDGAIVFKVYDSAKDGRARFTPHPSFEDPAPPPGAPPRQSIEARTFAFFA